MRSESRINDGMSHHCSPQSLHLLRFFFFFFFFFFLAFTSTCSNFPGPKSAGMPIFLGAEYPCEHPAGPARSTSRAERPAGSPGSPESRSRV
jgi:hypothetical protein